MEILLYNVFFFFNFRVVNIKNSMQTNGTADIDHYRLVQIYIYVYTNIYIYIYIMLSATPPFAICFRKHLYTLVAHFQWIQGIQIICFARSISGCRGAFDKGYQAQQNYFPFVFGSALWTVPGCSPGGQG